MTNVKEKDMNVIIYENVKRIAISKNISFREIEKKAGLGNGVINKWKTVSPKVSTVEIVAEALGVSFETLLEKKE